MTTNVQTLKPIRSYVCTHRSCPWMPLHAGDERADALRHAENAGHTVHVTETTTTIYRSR